MADQGAGDVDSGAELVVALVWFAGMSMRFELFGSVEELLDAPGIEAHQRFTDLCGAAALGSYFTLDGQVTERAETGLSAAANWGQDDYNQTSGTGIVCSHV